MLKRWEELTSAEVAALDRNTTVVFLPIGPLEEHGPHLPTGTDLYEAVEVTRRIADAAAGSRPDLTLISLPLIPVGADPIEAPGSIFTRASAVHDLAYDAGASLARQGFRFLFVVNHHGSPRHLVALELAARRVSRRFGVRMISPSSNLVHRLYFKGELTRLNDFLDAPLAPPGLDGLKRDCHAGAFETAEMLAVRPDLVKDEYRTLPHFEIPLHRFNPRTFMSLPGSRGYMGNPSVASVALGEAYYRFLAEEGRTLVLDLVDGKPIRARTHSPLVWVPLLWPRFKSWLLAGTAALASLAWWLCTK